jgi:capsular polysaccharide transport system permease protein
VEQEAGSDAYETIELIPIGDRPAPSARPTWFDAEALRSWLRGRRWFSIVVVLPTLLATLYFGLLAADRYEVESEFVIRSQGTAAASQLTSLMQGSGIVRSADDAYIIHAYIHSRDAVRKLAADIDLPALLAHPSADLLWRYPPPFLAANEERLRSHFERFVAIDYDRTTGLSTLKVQAFDPRDARVIAEALLADAEALINRMGERAQVDAIRTAMEEATRSEARALEAQNRVTDFRKMHAIVDPGRVSASGLETIARLALETAQTNAQLAELNKASPDSPQANALKIRIMALEEQIQKERSILAGADRSLAPLIADYERLVLEREFAYRGLASARAALDVAHVDAQRQRLFLERISTPTSPDHPKYPNRLLSILGTFAVTWLCYAVGRRLIGRAEARRGELRSFSLVKMLPAAFSRDFL